MHFEVVEKHFWRLFNLIIFKYEIIILKITFLKKWIFCEFTVTQVDLYEVWYVFS